MQTVSNHGKMDWPIFLSVVALAIGSLFHLYTVSFPEQGYYFFRQMIWIAIGMGFLFLFFLFKVSFWEKISYFLYGVIFILLVVVLFKGEGAHAHRWLRIGKISFQPSEFAKLALIFVLAKVLAKEEEVGWRKVIISLCFTFPFLILVAVEPDLGSALLFLPLWLGMLILAGISWKRFFLIVAAGLALFPFSFFTLRPYQKMRILTFLNPARDPLGSGWSVLQSKIALGSGGLMGKGFKGAVHTQLRFLSRPFTDFIFASVGEEWGFIGVVIVLGLYFIIISRTVKISLENGRSFAGLLSGGMAILVFSQVFVNVGMTAGIMPVTGMPLPLISYGGSSTIMFLSGMGILLSLKRRPWRLS